MSEERKKDEDRKREEALRRKYSGWPPPAREYEDREKPKRVSEK